MALCLKYKKSLDQCLQYIRQELSRDHFPNVDGMTNVSFENLATMNSQIHVWEFFDSSSPA